MGCHRVFSREGRNAYTLNAHLMTRNEMTRVREASWEADVIGENLALT